jgi:hypothetical protein
MTVCVDNARTPARVGGRSARWSHLTADTPDELHAFAAGIGLRLDWFQARCTSQVCWRGPCPHWHYDVTDSKRAEAIAAGAKPVDIRELGRIIGTRRSRADSR